MSCGKKRQYGNVYSPHKLSSTSKTSFFYAISCRYEDLRVYTAPSVAVIEATSVETVPAVVDQERPLMPPWRLKRQTQSVA